MVLIYFKFDPHISHLQTLATSSSFPLGHHVAQALCLSVSLCPILFLLGVPLTIRIFFFFYPKYDMNSLDSTQGMVFSH